MTLEEHARVILIKLGIKGIIKDDQWDEVNEILLKTLQEVQNETLPKQD